MISVRAMVSAPDDGMSLLPPHCTNDLVLRALT